MGHVSLNLRHARSLKDKRQILSSLKQRLKNLGFSVTETSNELINQGGVGFAFAGREHQTVHSALDSAKKLFADLEILNAKSEVFDFAFYDENVGVGEHFRKPLD